jgi:hypothetical protein
MRTATLIAALAWLSMPLAALADEDLVTKREFCRQEAKEHIAPKSGTGTDAYRHIFDRRNIYVTQCMTQPVVVKRRDLPQPPRPPRRRAL